MKPRLPKALLTAALGPVALIAATSVFSPVLAQEQPQGLGVRELIESIRDNHPVILAAAARREQSEYEQQRAQGAFDLSINQTTLSRLSGFYNGQYIDQTITKPLTTAGAEISAGYRKSDGIFPVYEDYFNTQTTGELRLDLKFSLLRDRDIDDRRIGLENAENLLTLGLTEEQISINRFVFEGVSVYLRWYQALLENQAVAGLVDLAETRRNAIESRVANGDLAAITLTEFETTLLTRQIALRETELNLQQAQQQLLFYWRDENGNSYELGDLVQPSLPLDWPFEDFSFDLSWQNQIINNHPTITELDAEIRLARNEARLAENDLLPDLDLNLRLARDMGSGPQSLDRPESYVGLSFSVPLERNRAKADLSAASARLRELEFQREAQIGRLQLQLNESLLQLNTFNQLRQLRSQQASVAKELENQEHARFDAGDSDQFLLNAREAQAGQAALDAISAEVLWLRQQLNLVTLSFDLLDI